MRINKYIKKYNRDIWFSLIIIAGFVAALITHNNQFIGYSGMGLILIIGTRLGDKIK